MRRLRVPTISGLVAALIAALALTGCGTSAPNLTARGTVRAFNADLDDHDYAGACALLTVTGRQEILSEDGDAAATTTCAAAMAVANVQQALTTKRLSAAQIRRAQVITPRTGSAMLHTDTATPRIDVLTRQHGQWLISSL